MLPTKEQTNRLLLSEESTEIGVPISTELFKNRN